MEWNPYTNGGFQSGKNGRLRNGRRPWIYDFKALFFSTDILT